MSRAMSSSDNRRTERLNLRTSADQQQLIKSAAAARYQSVSEFVLESATANAERILADRRWFLLDPSAWDEFQTLLEAPLGETPRLTALLEAPNIFDD
ncbi:MAG: type II toxin-antitoxin system TacA family antitoxin [Acidimicrobiales bacterium]